MNCPCGSESPFETCCGPFLSGKAYPETAEKLMRSRYTAYTRADIAYLQKTLVPEGQKDFDADSTREWAEKSKWKGLKIVDTKNGGPEDKSGMVEFVATYEPMGGAGIDHHEVSQFRRNSEGHWLFVDGEAHEHKEGEGHHHPRGVTIVRDGPKVGPNEPCPCGSGRKFKKCCSA